MSKSQKRKTASLFETGAKVGAYLAGANSVSVEETHRYGLNMGIAFQMVDDILDVVARSSSSESQLAWICETAILRCQSSCT